MTTLFVAYVDFFPAHEDTASNQLKIAFQTAEDARQACYDDVKASWPDNFQAKVPPPIQWCDHCGLTGTMEGIEDGAVFQFTITEITIPWLTN